MYIDMIAHIPVWGNTGSSKMLVNKYISISDNWGSTALIIYDTIILFTSI